MNKIIGLLAAWGAEDWVRPAIKQALEYCDEVMVVVTAWTPELKKFKDGTLNICKEYRDLRLLDYDPHKTRTTHAVCATFNHMLKNSRLFTLGNWVWILDADEFYADSAHRKIRSVVEDGRYDWIKIESRFFYINMQHYLKGWNNRLFRVENIENGFKPTNIWSRPARNIYTLPRKTGMFHYSMLTDTRRHRVRWHVTYHSAGPQWDRIKWLDEIYPKYDLEDEEYWIEENFKMFGIRSPWFNRGLTPNEEGGLFKYEGGHPKFIEEAGLHKVKDFREFNKAKKGGS